MHIKPDTPGNQWNWAESIKTIAGHFSRSGFALLLVTALHSAEGSVLQQRWSDLCEWGLSDMLFLTLRGDFRKNYSLFLRTAR